MALLLLICAIGIVLFVRLRKNSKRTKYGAITVCTGAVKTGKTTLAVWLALRNWFGRHVSWWIHYHIFRQHDLEEPLLYSNLPLKCKYVPLTTDILMRKVRINFGSVVLMDEASLVADSQLIHDKQLNCQLLLFFKLFGHETHGGSLIIDSQCISDLHYIIKRSVNQYIYINQCRRGLLFNKLYVLENRYSEDNSVIGVDSKDIDDNLKVMRVPRFVWKLFDTYCFSSLTDFLSVYNHVIKLDSLKTTKICSFRKEFAELGEEYEKTYIE